MLWIKAIALLVADPLFICWSKPETALLSYRVKVWSHIADLVL